VTRLFDAYIAVDWSARSKPSPRKPSPDAVWLAEGIVCPDGDLKVQEAYWNTRHTCREYLRKRLVAYAKGGRRVFVGFDFPYGFPSGFATALGLNGKGAPWRQVWEELGRLASDAEDNSNNRFEVADELNARCEGPCPGPLWGHPRGGRFRYLDRKSPACGYPFPVRLGLSIERLRWVDRREPRIQPIWKLAGTGSVGSQCLVGIPTVLRLRDDPELCSFSRVWPFEMGFTPCPTPCRGPYMLHVEIWPGVVSDLLDPSISIRDQAQVRAVVQWLAYMDGHGALTRLFDTPTDLPPEGVAAAVEEEGWIIGGGLRSRRPSCFTRLAKPGPQSDRGTLP
jgi:hypothetical protein